MKYQLKKEKKIPISIKIINSFYNFLLNLEIRQNVFKSEVKEREPSEVK